MILDEPTRGIDVGTRAQIHRLMREFAEQGRGVIVISSDFDELLGCDRVLVMARGAIVSELAGGAIGRNRMLTAAYGFVSEG
jgi:ribose transport system ATP-binding protein/rhamnose transport system ATP-binding protein